MKKSKKFLLLLVCVLNFQNIALAETDSYTNNIIKKDRYYKITDDGQIYTINSNETTSEYYSSFYSDDTLEEYYLSSYISPIKDQKHSSDCWAFATCGAMETAVMMKENTVYDFSENHIKYTMSTQYNSPYGYNHKATGGGTTEQGNTYMIFGSGFVLDSDNPHTERDIMEDYGITANYPSTGYVASGIINIPNLSDSDMKGYNETKKARITEVKKLIKKYGSVSSAIYSSGKEDINFYHSSSTGTNHRVLLVGWNDNYSKDEFKTNIPDGNGAFIVKNSWGTEYGENGLYYLSYYDIYACQDISCITDIRKKESNETINSYTGSCDISSLSLNNGNTTYYGNIFKKNYEQEQLKSVLLYMFPGQSYKISVFFSDVESNPENILYFTGDTTGKEIYYTNNVDYPGYYTINLKEPLDITNDTYAIRVETTSYLQTNDENGNIVNANARLPIESPTMAIVNNDIATLKDVSIEPMQSFLNTTLSPYNTDLNNFRLTIVDNDNATIKEFIGNFEINAITSSELSKSKIDYMSVVDVNNTKKTSFNAGETVKIAPVVNGINLEGKELYCCVYNRENCLVKLFNKKIENNNNVFTYEKIPSDFGSYEIRAFVFDSNNNITPLGNVKILNN